LFHFTGSGPVGPGRQSFMGRGGGQFHHGGGGFDRRSFSNDFDGPMNKKQKMQSPEVIFQLKNPISVWTNVILTYKLFYFLSVPSI